MLYPAPNSQVRLKLNPLKRGTVKAIVVEADPTGEPVISMRIAWELPWAPSDESVVPADDIEPVGTCRWMPIGPICSESLLSAKH